MKKFLSLILVILIMLGGILYIPEFYDKQMVIEGKTTTVIDDAEYRSSRSGKKFYVSNSGKDSNSGTSPSSAWKTVKKVKDELSSPVINVGDDIYFKRGDTFGTSTSVLKLKKGGTPTNEMIIGAYGSGDRPIFENCGIKMHGQIGIGHIKIENICVQNNSIIVCNGNWNENITIYNCKVNDMNNRGNNILINATKNFLIENCEVIKGGVVVWGSPYPNSNGIVRNCIASEQSISVHGDSCNNDNGKNFLIENCTSFSQGEDAFDISSGENIYIKDCKAYDTNGIMISHGVKNVTVDNLVQYNSSFVSGKGRNGVVFKDCTNLIIRNSIIHGAERHSVDLESSYTSRYRPVKNSTFYHNTIVENASSSYKGTVRIDYTDINNTIFKNNIFMAYADVDFATLIQNTGSDAPENLVDEVDWRHNIWWELNYDGSDEWLVRDMGDSFNFSETEEESGEKGWKARFPTELCADPMLVDPSNWNFYLMSGSPCIDAGDNLTYVTTPSGSGMQFNVDNANYFTDGYGVIKGDLILVGNNDIVEITEVDYSTHQIKINSSINWNYGDSVNLEYSGSAPDIGAYEYGEYQPEEYQPELEFIEDQTVDEDRLFSLNINTIQTGRQHLSWAFSTNASWLSWGTINHTLYGTPTNADVGKYWICINITDGRGGFDEHNFTLTVTNVNDPPVITTPNLTTCLRNELYWCDYDAVDIDPTNDELSWLVKTNASFLQIESFTGNLSGTPVYDDVGTYWVNISVLDGNGGIDFDNFTLIVRYINNAPQIINPPPDFSFNEDTIDISLNITNWFQDIDNDHLIYSYSGNKNIDVVIQDTGAVELKPTSNWSGTETLTFMANDTYSNVEDIINITVLPVNDVPFNGTIKTNITQLYVGQNFKAIGNALDVDIPYGDQLKFYWYINNSQNHFAYGKEINTPICLDNSNLPPGNYTIKLNIKDSELAMCNTTTQIEILYNINSQPEIISTKPVNNAFDVNVNCAVIINFNEPMNKKSVENSIEIVPNIGFYLNWDVTNKISEMFFINNLSYDTNYKITIGTSRDIVGNQLINAPYVLSFKTEKIILTKSESTSLSLTIISPTDYSEVRPNERITVVGSSVGLNEGVQVHLKLVDKIANGRIDSKGFWSANIRAPRIVGSYNIVVEAENLTQSVYINVIKQNEQNVKKPKYDFDIQESYFGIIILFLIILIILIIISIFIKKKRTKENKRKTTSRKDGNLNEKGGTPPLKRKMVDQEPLPVKLPKRKLTIESSAPISDFQPKSTQYKEEEPEIIEVEEEHDVEIIEYDMPEINFRDTQHWKKVEEDIMHEIDEDICEPKELIIEEVESDNLILEGEELAEENLLTQIGIEVEYEIQEEYECPDCGNSIEAEITICPKCGAEFE